MITIVQFARTEKIQKWLQNIDCNFRRVVIKFIYYSIELILDCNFYSEIDIIIYFNFTYKFK